MLEHLRWQVSKALASVPSATLATAGPAGIQASVFPCEADGLTLFLLLPSVSDQLLNLEHDQTVVISTPTWQLRGAGRVLALTEAPRRLTLTRSPQAVGCVLVAVQPRQLHLYCHQGWGFDATIDCDSVPSE